MISGTLRHEGAVVAEDQEPLAWAFGQVELTRRSSRQASGWATVDQVNRRFAAACAAVGLEGRRTSHGGRVGLAVELTARRGRSGSRT